jgi:S-adenosylmethionine decarboxylase
MGGVEWLIESHGCDPATLSDARLLQRLFDRIIAELSLTPVGAPLWHTFPPPGGVTGLVALAESHLTCHSFPEYGSICVNVFCCRPRPDWDASRVMTDVLGAAKTAVRRVERHYSGRPVFAAPDRTER